MNESCTNSTDANFHKSMINETKVTISHNSSLNKSDITNSCNFLVDAVAMSFSTGKRVRDMLQPRRSEVCQAEKKNVDANNRDLSDSKRTKKKKK